MDQTDQASGNPDPKRPKIISVSQPEQQGLFKPRVLTQTQATNPPAVQASQPPQLQAQPRPQAPQAPVQAQPGQQTTPQPSRSPMQVPTQPTAISRGSTDPKTEADWTEQTLSQAERDAEEQRMANDVTQAFATQALPATEAQAGQQAEAAPTPKTEPKSVPGLLYAIKGLANSISRKIAGK